MLLQLTIARKAFPFVAYQPQSAFPLRRKGIQGDLLLTSMEQAPGPEARMTHPTSFRLSRGAAMFSGRGPDRTRSLRGCIRTPAGVFIPVAEKTTPACAGVVIWRPHGDSNPGVHRERVVS